LPSPQLGFLTGQLAFARYSLNPHAAEIPDS
jgi:hypothetical protein